MADMKLPHLVALTGLSGVGKDEAAKCLIARGYKRAAFGDIIKRQVDALVREHFGFSAHTEDRVQKSLIRRTLEAWGEDNYDAILKEFFDTIPPLAVNTRLMRVKEAEVWHDRGGVLLLIERPGTPAATLWERERLRELVDSGYVDGVIVNGGTVEELHQVTLETLAGLRLCRRQGRVGAEAVEPQSRRIGLQRDDVPHAAGVLAANAVGVGRT